MSESTAVTNDGVPTIPDAARPPTGNGDGETALAGPLTHSDGPAPTGETVSAAGRAAEPASKALALLRGGPAAGKQVEVPRIADTFPMFIGIDGGNYVHDRGSGERPVYNWWPSGASSPAGDPNARSNPRNRAR